MSGSMHSRVARPDGTQGTPGLHRGAGCALRDGPGASDVVVRRGAGGGATGDQLRLAALARAAWRSFSGWWPSASVPSVWWWPGSTFGGGVS